MDQYNNNFNENQGAGVDNNASAQQNFAPQEQQINQADIYAPYNQPQSENVQESLHQQNIYAQNNANGYYQPQQNANQQSLNNFNYQSQQNVNQQSLNNFNSQPQDNPYSAYNQQQQYAQNNINSDTNQQQYAQNNPYGGTYNQPTYGQNFQNNGYGMYNQSQQYNAAYYNQQYPIYNFQEKPKGFAVASMILGICSVLGSCCLFFFTMITSIAGLVLGIVSLKRNEDGKGMAIAGIVLSSIGILLSIFTIIFFVCAMLEGEPGLNPYDYYNYY